MNRIVERTAASDPRYRKQIAGRPLRSDAVHLTDADLLARLHGFGIDLDRAALERLCDDALSAEEIAKPLLDQRTFETRREKLESDWIWICLTALWQRWFPEKPCFELLDDKIQAGYELRDSAGDAAACRVWLDAWADVLRIADLTCVQSIHEFDDLFCGTQSLFNWIQDLEDALWNAGMKDRPFLSARVEVCEEALRRFPTGDDPNAAGRRRALAESYYELGQTGKAEALFREWLRADPRWGWGWIGWSDCYGFTCTDAKDLQRAEQCLREGLTVSDVRERDVLLQRLASLCDEQGREEEARAFRRQEAEAREATRRWSSRPAASSHASASPVIAVHPKVGRNEPCPCGSGKKFKKCCGSASAG